MSEEAARIAAEMPLADRLIDDLIGTYIEQAAGAARATNPYTDDRAEAWDKAVDAMQHLHLAGAFYRLTPRILDALRRAGALRSREGADQ